MSSKDLHKIALGTAQFGLDYGLTSQGQPVSVADVSKILSFAKGSGITVLDTASAYGHAESLLGNLLPHTKDFQIITKIPASDDCTQTVLDRAEQSLAGSLARLKTDSIYALLLHDSSDLLGPDGQQLFALAQQWKAEGRIQKFGVSVYDVNETAAVFSRFGLEMVQLPINVFDQRFLQSGMIARLAKQGVEIHGRSWFLQGLLLMDENDLPFSMQMAFDILQNYRKTISDLGVSALAAALGFAHSIPEIDHVVIGVHSLGNLQQCIDAWDENIQLDFTRFACDNARVTDPRQWD